jgi:hypothetical protein
MLRTTQVGGYGQVVMPKNPDRRCGCDVCRMTHIAKRPVYKQTGLTRQHYEPPQDGEQPTAVVDIAGPFKPGMNGEKFAITLIVHQFRMAYTACIRRKSDSGAAMRQILKVIKDDPSYARYKPLSATHPLATIFSDQESSFHFHHNMEFRQLSERDIKERTDMVEDYRKVCAEFGITPIVTSSMTSQFNGLVESRHNQIRTTASALLYSAKLGMAYWPYAWAHAVFLLNIQPMSSLWVLDHQLRDKIERGILPPDQKRYNISPHFALRGFDYDTRNLRAFGATVFSLVPTPKGNLTACKARRGIYLGESRSRKAWKMIEPITGVVYMVTHATGIEDTRSRHQFIEELDANVKQLTEAKKKLDPVVLGVPDIRRYTPEEADIIIRQNDWSRFRVNVARSEISVL